jgi:transcription elongation factor Elf1
MLLPQNTTQSRTQEGKNRECKNCDLKFQISSQERRCLLNANSKKTQLLNKVNGQTKRKTDDAKGLN